VAKADLGTKRICPTTGRKFYDLNKNPVISPYSGEVVPIAPLSRTRPEPVAARAPVAPVAEAEPEAAEAAELVPLEEADAEAEGAKKVPVADADDVEVADDEAADDTTFLEPDEDEGEDDVADIIGGDIEPEEET
jgi:uncharacterized protein (TIGR02300 family)